MWPFNRKKEEPKEAPEIRMIRELREFKSVGARFRYLGVEMVVYGHCEFDGMGLVPALKCNYVDGHGVIRSAVFGYSELPALILENERGQIASAD